MSEKAQTGEDDRMVVTCHTFPGQSQQTLSFAHEEVDRLFDEVVQDVGVVCAWHNALHQDHLTLNESQEDVTGHHEPCAPFQSVLPDHTHTTS